MKHSSDPKVSNSGIEVLMGRKWSADKELTIEEVNLRVKSIVGSVAKGRTDLGLIPTNFTRKVTIKEGQQLIQDEVRAGMGKRMMTKVVGYNQQGAWTKWDRIERYKISWAEFWKTDFSCTKFLVQLVYGILPSPSNLYLWDKIDKPKCLRKRSQQHILSSCQTAVAYGRYCWRHDNVLEATALIITEAIQSSKFVPCKRVIRSVKPGTKSSEKQTKAPSL